MPSAHITYVGGMAFDAESESGHHLKMDAAPEAGGENGGFRPTELTAISVAGCTGVDVISILKKMRADIHRFAVSVEADRQEEHPRVFRQIRLKFELDADGVDADQYRRAVHLSADKYCSVSAMLENTATISRELWFNGDKLDT